MKGIILMVEDEAYYSRVYNNYLQDDLGYFVIHYDRGERALKDIRNELRFDFGLIDLTLPGIEGLEVIQTIRKKNPEKPLISMSEYQDKPDEATAHFNKQKSYHDLGRIIRMHFK